MPWTFKKVVKLVLLSLCLVAICMCGIGLLLVAFVVHDFSQELPVLASAQYRPPLTTKLYDVRGRLITELQNEENRAEIVSISQIPRLTQVAFVASEDKRFLRPLWNRPGRYLPSRSRQLASWSSCPRWFHDNHAACAKPFLDFEKNIYT